MNILFVCKYNRFRSRIAKSYFKKINKNKKNKAKSAGLVQGSPLSKDQILSAKKFGINIKGKRRGLSTKLLKWRNMTIIVADDVPLSIFKDNKKYGKKIIIWKIKDAQNNKEKEKQRIIKSVIKKVNKLVKNLEEK